MTISPQDSPVKMDNKQVINEIQEQAIAQHNERIVHHGEILERLNGIDKALSDINGRVDGLNSEMIRSHLDTDMLTISATTVTVAITFLIMGITIGDPLLGWIGIISGLSLLWYAHHMFKDEKRKKKAPKGT